VTRGEAMRRVEREIANEKSAVLGRAGERLERLLGEVAALGQQLDAAERQHAPDLAALVRAYDAAWWRAREARQVLIIQREAVGLRRHAVVDQQFPEPPRRPGSGLAYGRSGSREIQGRQPYENRACLEPGPGRSTPGSPDRS
jgi:hypothetical protein